MSSSAGESNEGTEVQEQARILKSLKAFCIKYKVHVILIAHPRAGEGLQKISGAMEQENMADTILYYVRAGVDENNKEGIPNSEAGNISAILFNRKVRDEGDSIPVHLEWNSKTGTVREITATTMPDRTREVSKEYFEKGWWSRPSNRIATEDSNF